MQQGSISQVQGVNDTQSDPLVIVPTPHAITPITSDFEMNNKRTFSDVMETEHEDNTKTSKKKKVEEEGQIIKVIETKGKKTCAIV